MTQLRVAVRIEGQVQGVSFRHYTRETARRLTISGWVKNLSDGAVAAEFEGQENNVREMIDWCRKGPPAARIEDLQVNEVPPRGESSSFEIVH